MKKILFLLLVISVFGFAQTQKVKIDSYNGSTHTYYFTKSYTNSKTDTTEFVNFADADSVKFFISTNDSVNVKATLIYGDGVLSNVTASAVIDSLIATTNGWKSLDWYKIVANCGNTIIGAKLKLAFQSAGNSSESTAKYTVFLKKYKK